MKIKLSLVLLIFTITKSSTADHFDNGARAGQGLADVGTSKLQNDAANSQVDAAIAQCKKAGPRGESACADDVCPKYVNTDGTPKTGNFSEQEKTFYVGQCLAWVNGKKTAKDNKTMKTLSTIAASICGVGTAACTTACAAEKTGIGAATASACKIGTFACTGATLGVTIVEAVESAMNQSNGDMGAAALGGITSALSAAITIKSMKNGLKDLSFKVTKKATEVGTKETAKKASGDSCWSAAFLAIDTATQIMNATKFQKSGGDAIDLYEKASENVFNGAKANGAGYSGMSKPEDAKVDDLQNGKGKTFGELGFDKGDLDSKNCFISAEAFAGCTQQAGAAPMDPSVIEAAEQLMGQPFQDILQTAANAEDPGVAVEELTGGMMTNSLQKQVAGIAAENGLMKVKEMAKVSGYAAQSRSPASAQTSDSAIDAEIADLASKDPTADLSELFYGAKLEKMSAQDIENDRSISIWARITQRYRNQIKSQNVESLPWSATLNQAIGGSANLKDAVNVTHTKTK